MPAPKPTDGKILSNGGRVLNVCATGKTVTEAQQRAYAAVDRINWPEGFYRRDIGWQAVASGSGLPGNPVIPDDARSASIRNLEVM